MKKLTKEEYDSYFELNKSPSLIQDMLWERICQSITIENKQKQQKKENISMIMLAVGFCSVMAWAMYSMCQYFINDIDRENYEYQCSNGETLQCQIAVNSTNNIKQKRIYKAAYMQYTHHPLPELEK